MTKLLDDVARAIAGEVYAAPIDAEQLDDLDYRCSRAALQAVARYLREPSEELAKSLGVSPAHAKQTLRALASHLEKDAGL